MENQGINSGTIVFAELELEGRRMDCPSCRVPVDPHLGNMIVPKFNCRGCRAVLTFIDSPITTVKCPCCHFSRPAPSTLTSLLCGGCEATVIYQKGGRLVKCSLCKHVTNLNVDHVAVAQVNQNVPQQVNRNVPPPQVNLVAQVNQNVPHQVNRNVPPPQVNLVAPRDQVNQVTPRDQANLVAQVNRMIHRQVNNVAPRDQVNLVSQVNRINFPRVNHVAPPQVNRIVFPQAHDVAPPQVNQVAPSQVNLIHAQLNRVAPPQVNQVAPPQANQVAPPDVNEVAPPGDNRVASPGDNQVAPPRVNPALSDSTASSSSTPMRDGIREILRDQAAKRVAQMVRDAALRTRREKVKEEEDKPEGSRSKKSRRD